MDNKKRNIIFPYWYAIIDTKKERIDANNEKNLRNNRKIKISEKPITLNFN